MNVFRNIPAPPDLQSAPNVPYLSPDHNSGTLSPQEYQGVRKPESVFTVLGNNSISKVRTYFPLSSTYIKKVGIAVQTPLVQKLENGDQRVLRAHWSIIGAELSSKFNEELSQKV